jgi:hypothetical protein
MSLMKRLFLFSLMLACATCALAQSNLLYNGNFELTQSEFYYDSQSTNQFALPGWEAFATGDAANSWVDVFRDTSNWRLDLSGSDADQANFFGLAGLQTAVSNRVVVIPGKTYYATLTWDNEEPAGVSFFIDWFNGGGNNFASVGGLLDDPNPLVFAPFTQRFAVLGIAPANAALAGVRIQCSNPDFVTGTADNFVFGIQPALTITRTGMNVVLSWTNAPSFRLQQKNDVSQPTGWTDLGSQNPRTNVISSSNSFYRLIGP